MKLNFIIIGLFAAAGMLAQEADSTAVDTVASSKEEGYIFTEVKTLPHTSVKDQNRSGTCWSFSGISFIESESMKLGYDSLNLSEMFIVRHNYAYKAERYVRTHGKTNFSQGGSFYDVLWAYDKYGMLTEEQYKGIAYGEEAPVFGELDAVFDGYIKGVTKNRNKKLSPVWKMGFNALLDTYFGELPETVSAAGTQISAKEYAKLKVGVDADNYVSITSYTHHPFYSSFILEIPDNWQWSASYNVPLDEMMEIFNYALDNGYTIAWGGDVSEKGFSYKEGVAIIPEIDVKEMADSERSKWEDKEKSDFYSFEEIVPEKTINQDLRQEGFDNWTTTDDH
nr:aminopeptidase [Bacteroidales bacterium]